MPRLEYHGPNFRYHVYWRQKGNIAWQEDIVQDPTLGHFERDVDEIFQVFEVQVKAENELGEAHQPAFTFQGRSGESGSVIVQPSKQLALSKVTENVDETLSYLQYIYPVEIFTLYLNKQCPETHYANCEMISSFDNKFT